MSGPYPATEIPRSASAIARSRNFAQRRSTLYETRITVNVERKRCQGQTVEIHALLVSSYAGLTVKIPDDSTIPLEKLTRYLLVAKVRNDKSKYLAQAGFTSKNPEVLLKAIRFLSRTVDAVEEKTTEYGAFYRVKGELAGVNGVNIPVIAVWLKRKADGKFQFITLIPGEKDHEA